MKFTHILVPRSYKKLLVRTVMDLKLSLQYFLLPSYFGDKLHRASYCHNKLLSPYTPSIWPSPTAQFVTKSPESEQGVQDSIR